MTRRMLDEIDISADRPVLIAGPTASGKSALALRVAERFGGAVINADAIQVFANWRILSARPSAEDEARAPHHLYGHVAADGTYSVGHWLRDVAPLLGGARPIVVGGTGLYFTALTEGLAEIPAIPADIRARGDALRIGGLPTMIADLAPEDAARVDLQNPMRVQRAWEVHAATGRALADWQAATPAPLVPLAGAHALLLDAPKDWLTPRIKVRFDAMITAGALDEARANLAIWDPAQPSSKCIGAADLIAHLRGEMPLEAAREAAIIATRQFAKRQRTWFRARMKNWQCLSLSSDFYL
ncbi:tRNA (adenosine(37)-N6)-dimethylallyltransferase MiaA [Roseovarius carneus]|uniref:tRNA (adenosine(37)-N6)-dimethylallyltransferase MiaA n=1 Tax=Roseovarius carneus TaxID=2853164 RepID=UPI001CCDD129|nr:tRNA (adenosine(37)-N6)-dimethylallyltransferase MiaA [Roseovarius carneus]